MQNVFEYFRDLFEKRYSQYSVLELGEDSIRYDFFSALTTKLNMNPWEIQLEYPLHNDTFLPRQNEKRKRNEKPQVDLRVKNANNNFCVEFAFFKRNKVDGSPGNDTAYTFKILNDMMRLGLQSHVTNAEAYFICVADEIMLGKRLTRTDLPKFPADLYRFDHPSLTDIMSRYKSAKIIDERFHKKLLEFNVTIIAEKVFDELVKSGINKMETRALVWKIHLKNQ